MKKQIKRTVSVVLSIFMIVSLFSIVPIEAGAATYGDWEYESSYNTCIIIGYNGISKNVTVPATINGKKVVQIIGAFNGNLHVETVTIPYGITEIGSSCFEQCVKLKSVSIPNTVNTLGQWSFAGCDSLESITISSNVKYIGEGAFYNCKSLKKVTIGKGVTSIDGSAFRCCPKLTSITIPGSVTSIENYAFAECDGLTSVTISGGVKKIGIYAFGCKNLNSITVPESVTTIGYKALGYYFPVAFLSEAVKKTDFIIYGKFGSQAEKYAKENGFKFIDKSPAAPTVSVANGVNGLDVAWGKVANAQSYVVYYKTATTNWSSFSTSSTRATISNAGSGKYYYVQVQSIGANGVKGNYSKVKTMTYLSRVNITSLTYNGNNTLKWNAVPGANKYQIARLKSGDKAYTYFYSTTPSLIEKNAVGGIAYSYQVRAMYQTSNSGTAYGAWSSMKSVPTLVAPTVTLSNKSNGIRVTWNSIRGAIRYIVYYKKSTDKGWSSAVTTNLYYPILNAQRGALYYVQVRPVGSKVSQPYSSVKSIVFK